MKFIKTDITKTITELRSQLYQELTAPIDAMWELLYINSAQHYLIKDTNQNMGYCCIDDKGSLLQLFLIDNYKVKMQEVVKTLIDLKLINSASLSSNEPVAFNACLFYSKSIKTNTFCFQYSNKDTVNDNSLNVELVKEKDIPIIKAFLMEQIGMDDTFGYTENLVERKEIFMVKESGIVIATSECRISDTQPEIADLGIIVNSDYRGKGIATQVFKTQVKRVLDANRKPICSTTVDNKASRKVIEKSGFYCSNIIYDINFIIND